MIPDELLERLSKATWPRPVPLADLLRELAEWKGDAVKIILGSDQTIGVVVSTILAMRRDAGLRIYELGKWHAAPEPEPQRGTGTADGQNGGGELKGEKEK